MGTEILVAVLILLILTYPSVLFLMYQLGRRKGIDQAMSAISERMEGE